MKISILVCLVLIFSSASAIYYKTWKGFQYCYQATVETETSGGEIEGIYFRGVGMIGNYDDGSYIETNFHSVFYSNDYDEYCIEQVHQKYDKVDDEWKIVELLIDLLDTTSGSTVAKGPYGPGDSSISWQTFGESGKCLYSLTAKLYDNGELMHFTASESITF